ncbi:hypothetical protein AB834_04635 [PVC group bacterium (ex Bugula neritina AB1)]|nr:hypothetical protein AB834_04635 [PVC group bacterium (ex Bugula neritina AB1)]
MKICIAGGKSGGHLYLGVAVAQQFSESGDAVVFFCSDRSLDESILRPLPWIFRPFYTKSPSEGLLSWFFVTLQAFFKAKKFLKKDQVDAVIGTGGFVSVPIIFAAFFLRLPIILLEPNAVPGRATRLLSFLADKICLGFVDAKSESFFAKRVRFKLEKTGVPIRKAFLNPSSCSKERVFESLSLETSKINQKTILVTGGSQGASRINNVILELAKKFSDILWIHIAGKKHESHIKELYRDKGIYNVKVLAFHENMSDLMLISDLVISRAGASSLAEICALDKSAIIIPLKNSMDDHQYYNALACRKEGKRVCFKDSENLLEEIQSFITSLF